MNWEDFETYVSGFEHGKHTRDEIEIRYLGKEDGEKEPYVLQFTRFDGEWNVIFQATATGSTILHAADLLRDLVEVHKKRLPSGVKGLLPPKPRGKAGLKRVK